MKKYIFYCLSSLIFLVTELSAQNLCGYWAGYGYQCYRINLDGTTTFISPPYELIYLSQNNDTIVAQKIIGDNCVTSGFPTWKGILLKNEKIIKATLYLGSPLQPNSSFTGVELSVINNDSLKMYYPFNINAKYPTYKKLSCEEAQKLGADLSDIRYNCNCDNSQSCTIVLPNAFTPNNDGLNDTFAPITSCQYKNYEFKVFNRWGNLVFDSYDVKTEWDGSSKGNILASDVYIWLINGVTLSNKSIKQSGEVILLR